MPDLNDLAILARVAERLNFDAAARDLGLSASTISRRVAALEARLGLPLVQRTTRSVKLTPAGIEYARHCKAMLAEADLAEASVRTHFDGLQGELYVNAPALFGRLVLAPIVAEFALRNPAVQIRLTLSNTRIDLAAERTDLVIRTGELPDSSLRARRLANAPFAVVASPGCLARHGTPKSLAEIAALPCVTLDRGGDRRWCGGSLAEPIAVKTTFSADDNEVLRDAAIKGVGFAFLPRFAAADALHDGRLIALTLDVDLGAVPVSMVFPGHKVPNKSASALADAIAAAIARDPAWRPATHQASAAPT